MSFALPRPSTRPPCPRGRRPGSARLPGPVPALALLGLLAPTLAPTLARAWAGEPGGPAAGHAVIRRASIELHLENIATPRFEGRESPSPGLRAAAEYISERFAAIGLEPAPDSLALLREHGAAPPGAEEGGGQGQEGPAGTVAADRGSFLRPFTRPLEAPLPDGCELIASGHEPFVYGRDFVPVMGCAGRANGELVFAGFGIEDKKERYDDLSRLRLGGKIALIFEGAPRNPRRFGGGDGHPSASLWSKLERLSAEGVAGVLVVRRPQVDHPDYEFDYRYGIAVFMGEAPPRAPRGRPPVLEITYDAATRLLGRDARALAEQIDRSVRPVAVPLRGVEVRMAGQTRLAEVRVDNVVGILSGSDPELKDEYVVLGAHYDHIGVDLQGRIGPGADDNGSGVAGLLEVAAALAEARPRRSILVAAFGAEEAGLLGSAALTRRLPVERGRLVAMINLDMIGRGDAREVAVLGTERNRHLERVVQQAQELSRTGLREVVTGRGQELWTRSDHYSFHKIGVPSLFFFEGLPISRNPDYHTWRDTLEKLDPAKIENTTRMVFNTAWLLANDEVRPPPSRE